MFNGHNVFACYPLCIASLFPLHLIQLAMQTKMTDIIENYEGMSLEAISLFPQFPIYSNYHPYCLIYHSSETSISQ